MNDLFKARFVRGGRDVRTGLDCQGLFLEVMRRYGHDVTDRDVAAYATFIVAAAINSELASGKWQRIDAPEEGCAVGLALDPENPAMAQHLGVCIGRDRFIHIMETHGVKVSAVEDRFFRDKIRGFYRWVG
ncbi:MAG: NlpC/P60 family protein [Deltaproteobacteria bacterium]|nr:NlpC/P60 family protein [Deltaproteobacteria bacterium]